MNRTVILLLTIFLVSTETTAQTLKEKIAAKAAALMTQMPSEKSGGGSIYSKPAALNPNVSQSEIAAKWEDKEYDKYQNGVRTKDATGIKVRIGKEGDKVNSIWLGDTEYRADEYGKSDFVRYYETTGGGYFRVVFTDNKIIVFTTNLSGQSRARYFLNKPGDYDDVLAAASFVEASKTNQKADLDAYANNQKANADKAYKEKEAIYSIKGKSVKKLEVTDVKAPDSFGYYRSFNFQVKATLANGKTISTKDGGFWSDYDITYKNGDVKSKTIQDTKFITGDKIVITVKSKFDSKIVATADAVMDYSETLTLNNNSNNWGKSAFSYKLEVKQKKHAVSGKQIILIKVTDLSGYKQPKYMIIDANQSLNIYANGHKGYKTAGTGNETGPGENGGNGGNITVIKDPSVKNFNINYTMNGGIGGAGTYGYNRGRDGRDGTYKEEVRSVNF